MITYEERKIFEDELYKSISDNPQYSLATYKLLYHLLNRIDKFALADINTIAIRNEMDHYNHDELSDAFAELLKLAFEYAATSEKPLFYTTGQIATYFGVSTTTINNWLRDKRITYPGIDDKPSHKQARIPDTAVYTSTNGKETVIREVIQNYEYQKANEPAYDEVERIKSLVQTLMAFESKYKGTYEETVARLGDPSTSEDWKWTRDADEWRYVMKELTSEG
ncbi:hypothetical protein ACF3MZ_28150 [Paenibacillaceae bacterium WGS1546]|uniref:hypothetical protein n=1 Tax=Cohnella sp. WGS1546 TaxID=3366810 RepID=UPI00372D5DA9